MKKIVPILLSISCLALTGCSFLNPFDFFSGILNPESSEQYSYDSKGSIIYSVDIEDKDEITVGKDPYTPKKNRIEYTYKDLFDHSLYEIKALPASGDVKILVIPIWFTDSSDVIDETSSFLSPKKVKNDVRNDIYTAFFGDAKDTNWHSVSSYYRTASYGDLNISGNVTDWYSPGKPSSYYTSNTLTSKLLEDAVNWAKSQYRKSVDFTQYDSDHDGYLDCVCMVYAQHNSNYKPNSIFDRTRPTSGNQNLWAYTFWDQNGKLKNKTNPGPNTFLWASYDFMYPEYSGGNALSNDSIDAHTFIHEMGHVLGLEDYYDYNDRGSCAAGGFSMQDYNVGGHDPFSRMSLGWIKPYVPTNDCEITIKGLDHNGDVVVLSPNFINSPFDEYVILELYNNEGLNKQDHENPWGSNYPTGSKKAGIRAWHVDARLLEYASYPSSPSVGFTLSRTIKDKHYYHMGPSNTTYGLGLSEYASVSEQLRDFKLLYLIRNNSQKSCEQITQKDFMNAKDLFYEGDVISLEKCSNQFPRRDKLDKGMDLPFEVTVKSLSDTSATLDIKILNKNTEN